MRINISNKTLYVLVGVLVIAIAFFVGYNSPLKKSAVPVIVENEALIDVKEMFASVSPKSKSQTEIDERCPFYEPDGATYRACLFDLLDTKEKEISNLRKSVISRLSEVRVMGNEYQHVFEKLIQYDRIWLDYRDSFCDIDNVYYYGGNGQEEFVAKCKIDEIQKYTNVLGDIKETWILNQK